MAWQTCEYVQDKAGQLASSEKSSSPQSLSPSQCHSFEIHFPDEHVNCSVVQVASGDTGYMISISCVVLPVY